jgi:serine/threonine-protein kinase
MTTVGPYVLGERLGAGGMGVVYKAQGPGGEWVALKVLHPCRRDDLRARRRFRDEADAGRIVRHPRVASVLGHGEADGVPYLVMRYATGAPLGLIAASLAALTLPRMIGLVTQILDALGAVHDAGIVHGDIKSDNVLVASTDATDAITLIDFGLASVRFADDEPAPPPAALVSGTPEYMAPELLAGANATIASDLYGVGVILYELLTGAPPWTGGSATEVFASHRAPIVPPSQRCGGWAVPAILERIAMRALQPAPDRRFRSAREFQGALEVADRAIDDAPVVPIAQVRDPSAAITRAWMRPARTTVRTARAG